MPVDLKSYIKGLVIKGGLLAALAVPGLHLEAQQTFNVKFDLGSGTLADALIEVNDGYLVCGAGFDMYINKLDKYGGLLSSFHLGEEKKEFHSRTKVHGTFADGTHLIGCLQVQPGPNECMLIWFDNDGEQCQHHLHLEPEPSGARTVCTQPAARPNRIANRSAGCERALVAKSVRTMRR
jgi:hypothetical protein